MEASCKIKTVLTSFVNEFCRKEIEAAIAKV